MCSPRRCIQKEKSSRSKSQALETPNTLGEEKKRLSTGEMAGERYMEKQLECKFLAEKHLSSSSLYPPTLAQGPAQSGSSISSTCLGKEDNVVVKCLHLESGKLGSKNSLSCPGLSDCAQVTPSPRDSISSHVGWELLS